ncbi:bifunctional DNA-binding transcriptional regulator/O6-methylguanine-DNA methyltransferase Ada [Silvibacterium dinghuense]|uniref:methylated-DNA--[protein]-cysteine S-methyltransferase n=2 Tax=Silvibacterium dinghuense TaxID=1560006 RepID=A0A4Q1SKJ3_9BACT|nr:bifunctional DNA-binding transcriptional regulator/O6-methylguanine-DNA methyltransferase Ada [Silvibacterium dinghuense]
MAGTLDPDQAWQLVSARDARADGRLFYAVRTTGIVCRPSCPSRRPARANVEFFSDLVSAFAAGYRPCYRCTPAGVHTDAQRVETLCAHLRRHLDRPVPLAELAALVGLSPLATQRLFRRVLGLSPAQFQAQSRTAALRHQLNNPVSRITDAIYDAGYSGPSRMYENAALGMRPADYRRRGQGQQIGYAIGDSPLGRLLIAATSRGLCAVILGTTDDELLVRLHTQSSAAEIATQPDLAPMLAQVLTHLTEHPVALDLPLDLRATAFQMRVWTALRRIPRGETRTYAQLARDLGQPTAARAVARACASNPVAVVIPCHRVIGSDGKLTGYRWGVERKQKLLALESNPKNR